MPSSWVASSRANRTLASLLSAYARSSCCQPTTGQSRRVKSRRPRRWAADDTITTRLGAHDLRRGSNKCVSRKGPTWFTRNSRLKVSRVRPQELIPRAEARHEVLFIGVPQVLESPLVRIVCWRVYLSRLPAARPQGLLLLTCIVDEDVQPWLRA